MPDRESLAAAFAATTYRVAAGARSFDLRIGAPHADFDRQLIEQAQAEGRPTPRGWAIVTAYNPGGVCSDDNARRQTELEARVRAAGWRYLDAVNISDDGRWPTEPALLLLDLDDGAARRLAAEFAQAAIVCGNIAGRAALVWVEA